MRVFPVPFTDKIKLQFNEEIAGNISWSLYNANGMLLKEGEQTQTTLFELNGLAAFQEGVYYLKVQCDNITKTFKLIK